MASYHEHKSSCDNQICPQILSTVWGQRHPWLRTAAADPGLGFVKSSQVNSEAGVGHPAKSEHRVGPQGLPAPPFLPLGQEISRARLRQVNPCPPPPPQAVTASRLHLPATQALRSPILGWFRVVVLMQSGFPADEAQPGARRGESLIRKRFKSTTSALCFPEEHRVQPPGEGPTPGSKRGGCPGAAGRWSLHSSDVAHAAARQHLAHARNSGPRAGEAAGCGSDTASPSSWDATRQQEVPRSRATLAR